MTTATAILLVVALMTLGMLLTVAEVAIIPGFGVAGLAAAGLIIGGVVIAWQKLGPTWGVGSLLIAAAATGAVITIAPRTRAGRALVLSTELKKSAVNHAAIATVGEEGISVTPLRPAGAVEIGGRRVDVVTDGVFVEAGRAVRVIAVEGGRVVVAPV
jgi:membrane-bound serine protease (ClpP class)